MSKMLRTSNYLSIFTIIFVCIAGATAVPCMALDLPEDDVSGIGRVKQTQNNSSPLSDWKEQEKFKVELARHTEALKNAEASKKRARYWSAGLKMAQGVIGVLGTALNGIELESGSTLQKKLQITNIVLGCLVPIIAGLDYFMQSAEPEYDEKRRAYDAFMNTSGV